MSSGVDDGVCFSTEPNLNGPSDAPGEKGLERTGQTIRNWKAEAPCELFGGGLCRRKVASPESILFNNFEWFKHFTSYKIHRLLCERQDSSRAQGQSVSRFDLFQTGIRSHNISVYINRGANGLDEQLRSRRRKHKAQRDWKMYQMRESYWKSKVRLNEIPTREVLCSVKE